MKKYSEKIDLATNILTIIVAILFIGIFAQKYFFSSSKTSSKTPTIGKQISIENFDFSTNKKNVFIVMMKGCRFCEASMAFYKKLIQQNQNNNIKIIAVFPPESPEIETYLKKYGIIGFEIKYLHPSSLETEATPTIIVTDETGKIIKYWIGSLSEEKEMEVTTFLN